jgi:hemolysin activation/secretion protein
MRLLIQIAVAAALLNAQDGELVREIRVSGGTVFSKPEIEKITREFQGQRLTLEQIEEMRLRITRLYVDAGYINSGALIGDPAVKDGVVEVQIVEGGLTSVEVSGNRWMRSSYLTRRARRAGGTPLKVDALQQRLQLFNLDGLISRFDAQLLPGRRPGESVLRLAVDEEFPVHAYVTYNNYQAPAVGANRGQITAVHQNVTGLGDALSVTYGRSSGISPLVDASYTFPLTPFDTTITAAYRRNNSLVVEELFQALDITSRTNILSFSLRQPFLRRVGREFAVGVAVESSRNETFLLGERFSFSPGVLNGRSKIAALRVFQEWMTRSQTQVITVRSRFSLGLNAFGATLNDERLPDSRFLSWLGQAQFARRVRGDVQLIVRGDAQLASDPLLPLEQMPVGGRYTVRGYRENQLVRDNGVVASFEARAPVRRQNQRFGRLEAAAFFDFGHAWNRTVPGLAIETLAESTLGSAGLGLRWSGARQETRGVHPVAEIYWGVPLNRISLPGGRTSLQDLGLHFQIGFSIP